MLIRKYIDSDIEIMKQIWNEVVFEHNAFPQTEVLSDDAADFFASQSFCGVAEDKGKVCGMYILHPNNIGHCGHIANASYAVKSSQRGKHIGEMLVKDSLLQAKQLGFGILQFNAVVSTNFSAIHIYKKLGFTELGTIPNGYRKTDGSFENITLFYHTV